MNANSKHYEFAPRAAVLVAVALCLLEALKLAMFCCSSPADRVSDSGFYWQLSDQVAEGDLWMQRDAVAFRTPGYPWFLGAAQALFGRNAWLFVVVSQYLVVWLTTVVTGFWTFRLTRKPWLAVSALAVCLMSAARPSYGSIILTETFFTFFLTLTIATMCLMIESSTVKTAGVMAVFWGISWIIRPAAAAIVPAWLITCWLAYRGCPDLHWKMHRNQVAVTIGVLIVMLGPWVVRNAILFNRPSLTVFLGRELWVTTFGPGQPTALPLPDSVESARLRNLVLESGDFTEWNGNWTVAGRLKSAGLSDAELDELMQKVAVQAIRRNPLQAFARGIWRAIDFWRAVYSREMAFYLDAPEKRQDLGESWNSLVCERVRTGWLKATWESRLIGIEFASIVSLCGLAGLWLSPKTWRVGAVVSAAILGTALLTSAVEYPSYRYRMVLEPLMIVSAIAGWNVIFDVINRGTRSLWRDSAL